jgi:hypothetical protein
MAAIQKIIQLGRDNKIPELREYLSNQVRLQYGYILSCNLHEANVQIKDLKRIYIENQQSFLVPSTE